ncbi:MAG: class I SAM-dependent methyltransferase, partial [Acidimicrobiales bacterium]
MTPESSDIPELNPWLEAQLVRHGGAGRVLDLGCGRGYWMERMVAAGLDPVGLEHELPRALDALRHAPAAVADGAHLPVADASMSLVWCIHVLHHLHDPVQVLAEIRRVLRPDGHLVLAETVEDHPVIAVGRRIHPEWDGVGVHSRFTAAEMVRLLGRAGFEVVDRRQHSLFSFAAWALPGARRRTWVRATRIEAHLPRWFDRWGAHLECVA